MLDKLTAWFLDLAKSLISAIWDLLSDFLVFVLDTLLGVVEYLLGLISVPDFLSGGLNSVWASMPSGVLWIVSQAGLPQALAIIGTAYGFRLIRKLVTLFQW